MAIFYAAFFAFSGIQMPYLPAWFASRDLDAREIGILLAVPMLARIIALPTAARLIDRRFDHRVALTIAALAAAVGYAMMGMTAGFIAILAAYTAIALASALVLPLGDAYALRGLGARGLAYGPVRLWGSVAFILANLAGGTLLAALGAAPIIVVLAAAMAITAGATLLLPLTADGKTGPAVMVPTAGGAFWRSGAFVTIVLGACLIQASHAVLYGFVTLQWSAAGLDGTTIGLLWAIGVVAEVLLFAGSGRLIARIGAVETILLGALGGTLRWTAMAVDPPATALPFLQCLHGLSFGATHVGVMHVLARLAEHHGGATVQGDSAALQGVTFAVAMLLSGDLVGNFGSRAYLAMAVLSAAGFVIAAIGRRGWHAEVRA